MPLAVHGPVARPSVDHRRQVRLSPSPSSNSRSWRAPCASTPDPLPRIAPVQALLRSRVATPPISFRPRGFSPPRRLSPHPGRERRRPLPTMGFIAFPVDLHQPCPRDLPSVAGGSSTPWTRTAADRSPRRLPTPRRTSPRASTSEVRSRASLRGRSLRRLPPCGSAPRLLRLVTVALPLPPSAGAAGSPPLRGLPPTRGRCPPVDRRRSPGARPPWACFVLQVRQCTFRERSEEPCFKA
jgi:hypothetical protein